MDLVSGYGPASGFKDASSRWEMNPEVVRGEKKNIQARLQA